ncbi:hypothetical protein LZ554_001967 [Drepanopeziza brunnea f. sp. 'monogermtubi']|nr:hypothetical protein LZ554_001967 [Drepanopeziza brunnea f. sp. 'monogermtubi']
MGSRDLERNKRGLLSRQPRDWRPRTYPCYHKPWSLLRGISTPGYVSGSVISENNYLGKRYTASKFPLGGTIYFGKRTIFSHGFGSFSKPSDTDSLWRLALVCLVALRTKKKYPERSVIWRTWGCEKVMYGRETDRWL